MVFRICFFSQFSSYLTFLSFVLFLLKIICLYGTLKLPCVRILLFKFTYNKMHNVCVLFTHS